MTNIVSRFDAVVSNSQLTIVLFVVAGIFLVFIVVAVVKTYRLNAENKKLLESDHLKAKDDDYKDFTEGHLYENKK